MNCLPVLSGETPDLLFPASNAAIQELLPTGLTKLNPYIRRAAFPLLQSRNFPVFQTRLLYIANKACLETKEALFVNEGIYDCKTGISTTVFSNGRNVEKTTKRKYEQLVIFYEYTHTVTSQ